MSSAHIAAAAFGSATLANCEREQIHLAGSIQPYGALLVVEASDFTIRQASANATEFLGLSDSPLGRKLRDLGGDLWRLVGSRGTPDPDAIPVAVHCRLGRAGEGFNALLHHAPSGEIVIELERAGEPFDHSAEIELALQGVIGATLVVSLMVGGKLWGLVSCHHYAPRYLHFEMRAVRELLGEILGTRIAALESFQQGQGELSVRRLEQRMIESISRDGDWRGLCSTAPARRCCR